MIENMVQMAKLTVKTNVLIVRTDKRFPFSVIGTISPPDNPLAHACMRACGDPSTGFFSLCNPIALTQINHTSDCFYN